MHCIALVVGVLNRTKGNPARLRSIDPLCPFLMRNRVHKRRKAKEGFQTEVEVDGKTKENWQKPTNLSDHKSQCKVGSLFRSWWRGWWWTRLSPSWSPRLWWMGWQSRWLSQHGDGNWGEIKWGVPPLSSGRLFRSTALATNILQSSVAG